VRRCVADFDDPRIGYSSSDCIHVPDIITGLVEDKLGLPTGEMDEASSYAEIGTLGGAALVPGIIHEEMIGT